MVLLDGRPIGLIQCCRFHDHLAHAAEMADVHRVGPAAAPIDYCSGDTSDVGRGIGTAMIRSFVERV